MLQLTGSSTGKRCSQYQQPTDSQTSFFLFFFFEGNTDYCFHFSSTRKHEAAPDSLTESQDLCPTSQQVRRALRKLHPHHLIFFHLYSWTHNISEWRKPKVNHSCPFSWLISFTHKDHQNTTLMPSADDSTDSSHYPRSRQTPKPCSFHIRVS